MYYILIQSCPEAAIETHTVNRSFGFLEDKYKPGMSVLRYTSGVEAFVRMKVFEKSRRMNPLAPPTYFACFYFLLFIPSIIIALNKAHSTVDSPIPESSLHMFP